MHYSVPSPWADRVSCRGSIAGAPAESMEVPACSDSVYNYGEIDGDPELIA